MEDGVLYTRTQADSWKVKRLKRNSRIKAVPSDARGEPLGEWMNGSAYEIVDSAQANHVNELMNKKYGLLKRGFDWMGKLRGHELTAVRIELDVQRNHE